jgi:nucleotide-binding universal stress UspA family protein
MYQKIVVPLDGSELAECVFPHIEGLVKACSVREIVFIRVVVPTRPFHGDFAITKSEVDKVDSGRKNRAEQYLRKILEKLKYEGVKTHAQVLVGGVSESITEYSANNKIEMIVIATHGRSGVGKFMLGSIADRLLRSSSIPVLMVRAPGSLIT